MCEFKKKFNLFVKICFEPSFTATLLVKILNLFHYGHQSHMTKFMEDFNETVIISLFYQKII